MSAPPRDSAAVKVVFLDMDGVVNCAEWFRVTSKTQYRKERGKGKACGTVEHNRKIDEALK